MSWRRKRRVRDENAPPPKDMARLLLDPAFRAELREEARVEGPKMANVVRGGTIIAITGAWLAGYLADQGVIPITIALGGAQVAQFVLAKHQGNFGALAAVQAKWRIRGEKGENPRATGMKLMEEPRPGQQGRGRKWLVRGVVAGSAAVAGAAYAAGLVGTFGAAGMFSASLAAAWLVAKARGRAGQVAQPSHGVADKVPQTAWPHTHGQPTGPQAHNRSAYQLPSPPSWHQGRVRAGDQVRDLGAPPGASAPPSLGQPPVPYPAPGWAEQYARPPQYAAPPQRPYGPQGERRTDGRAGGRRRFDPDGRRPGQGGREQS